MKTHRRIFAIAVIALALFPASHLLFVTKAAKPQYIAYVGTYTDKTQSKGIYAFRYDPDTGKLTPLGVAAETKDPSWVAVHPSQKFLYAANEHGKDSTISAFAINPKTGSLTLLNSQPALGEDPCYLAFDRTGKFLLIANYTSGNVVVYPILPDGKLGEHTANVKDEGTLGPNKERQDGPHAHWLANLSGNVYVADLGLDKVLVYEFDRDKGTLGSMPQPGPQRPFVQGPLVLAAGTGPRHVAAGKRTEIGGVIYVLGELDSTITVFGTSKEGIFGGGIQKIATLPAGFSGRNDSAEIEIHPGGKFLYASNRGHDSFAVYSINPKNGSLTLVEIVPTGGKEPRHFLIDPSGKHLLAENQLSDTIVVFDIDAATGKLTPNGNTASVPSPVSVALLKTE